MPRRPNRPAAPFGDIVARAAPPPERADSSVFEPAPGDPAAFARRRAALVRAFGSEQALAAHARGLGLEPDSWIARFGDVRLAGPAPDWARAFAAAAERLADPLADGDAPFAGLRRHARAEADAAWPPTLPRGPDALDGPLDALVSRLDSIVEPTRFVERRLGAAPDWETRFRRAPALAFAIGRAIADWSADIARIARRADADRALLAQTFFDGADPGPLLGIGPGLGDPHAGGRSVARLRFERGAVFYKPKDLRIAHAVADIVAGLDAPGLAPPALLARGGYAWEAEHRPRPLAREGAADAFFAALGAWIAVFQSLGGSDMWFDNLIADGATPRFIDFETAAQPAPRRPPGAFRDADPTAVGILPLIMPVADGVDPTDLGCLSRPGEHRTPLRDPETGTLLSWSEHRFAPHGADGAPIDAAAHFDALEEGYLRAARALPGAEARIAASLRRIADAPARIILIDTWTCYRIVRRSLAPRHLSDGAWREIALHAALPRGDDMTGVIREAAVRDLRRLDVPLFQTRLGSRDLWGIEGESRRGFFARDCIAETHSRLRALGAMADDERVAPLRSGFAMRAGNPRRRAPSAEDLPPAAPGDLLAWADGIGAEVARRAADDDGAPNWTGAVRDVFTGWRALGPLSFDVLSGRAGVALALLELAARLGRPALAALARESLEGAARRYIDNADAFAACGAGHVVGAGGLVAACARAGLDAAARETWRAAASREVWMRSGADYVSGLDGWREAARALGEAAPGSHGAGRPYAPSALPWLAPWLDPERARVLCVDRAHAARLRRDRDRHGSWFAAGWLDDRHNLSGVDGLPALAARFARLADPDGDRLRLERETSTRRQPDEARTGRTP